MIRSSIRYTCYDIYKKNHILTEMRETENVTNKLQSDYIEKVFKIKAIQ